MLQIIQIVSGKPHCNYRFCEQELELQLKEVKFEGKQVQIVLVLLGQCCSKGL